MATRKKFVPKEAPAEVISGVEEAQAIEGAPQTLTVNGKPIPEGFEHLIDYKMTDQGQAEAKAKADREGRPMVQVVRDEWDNTLDRKANAEIWDSFDPLKEAVDRVREPGMSYRFISDRVLKRRGRRGWEPVVTPDGKNVEVAGMKLGKMPIGSAVKRNEHYRELGNEALAAAAEQYELDSAKAIRDAKVKGFAPLQRGEVVSDNHAHPGMVSPIGVETVRGHGAAAE